MAISVKAYITEDGQIKAALPEDHPVGDVTLIIESSSATEPGEERPLSDEEIQMLMQPEPKSGAESIALGHVGGWEDKGIVDSVEWVKQQRRKRSENRGW